MGKKLPNSFLITKRNQRAHKYVQDQTINSLILLRPWTSSISQSIFRFRQLIYGKFSGWQHNGHRSKSSKPEGTKGNW